MRFEGSLRFEIFFFGKCTRQEHGTPDREDTMRKAKSVYTLEQVCRSNVYGGTCNRNLHTSRNGRHEETRTPDLYRVKVAL